MPKKYQSFAQQFYLHEASLLQRLGRDLRLLNWMLQTVRMWWKARSVRAEFERCRATNQPFYVDRFAGPAAATQNPAVRPGQSDGSHDESAGHAERAEMNTTRETASSVKQGGG